MATGLSGASAVAAARSWIETSKALYRLTSIDGLVLYGDSRMPFSDGHAVHFKQTFGGLTAAQDGLITLASRGRLKVAGRLVTSLHRSQATRRSVVLRGYRRSKPG